MWLFIVFVSVHDGYWVLANRQVMWSEEQNPLARWLIVTSGRDIWVFLALKAAGTVVVATLLLVLHSLRQRVGWAACAATAAFQLGLLAYLYWP